jgi:hypothetical protein
MLRVEDQGAAGGVVSPSKVDCLFSCRDNFVHWDRDPCIFRLIDELHGDTETLVFLD